MLHLPSLFNETYALRLSWTPPKRRRAFPNLGKAACAQVRKRDSASNARQITNTYTCSFKTRQSHRRQQWPACMCVTKGKRDPIRELMTDYFCNCLRKMSPAQPWETVTRTETGQGGKLHLEDEGPGRALCSQSGQPQVGWLVHPEQWQTLL